MLTWIEDYCAAQRKALDSIRAADVAALVEVLVGAWRAGKQIFVCGNGGSASNASHFVTDLGKGSSDKLGKRFKVLSLNDNVSWMTAIGNDYAYEDIFVRQLENYGNQGDVLIAVSVSGNSPNVVKALEWAKAAGLTTIALAGGKRGRAVAVADHAIVVEETHYGRVEDVQMNVLHMLCYVFMENPELFPVGGPTT
jgi:D-sedoheptulose 7-phosphate isomerase